MAKLMKRDPFLVTAIVWGLGMMALYLVITFLLVNVNDKPSFANTDRLVTSLIPPVLALGGGIGLVRYVGARPVFYGAVAGFTLGFMAAFIGWISALISRGFTSDDLVFFVASAMLGSVSTALPGALGAWWATRGKRPIAIELPEKDAIKAAKRAGLAEPRARIVTDLSDLPGERTRNADVLAKLDAITAAEARGETFGTTDSAKTPAGVKARGIPTKKG